MPKGERVKDWLLARTWKYRWAAELVAWLLNTWEALTDSRPSWGVCADGKEVHAYPFDDWLVHDIDGLHCVCGPDVEWHDPDTAESYERPLVMHHSLDGREQDGPGRVDWSSV